MNETPPGIETPLDMEGASYHNNLFDLFAPPKATVPFAGRSRDPPRYKSVGEITAIMVLKGQLTLESFDEPTPSFLETEAVRKGLGYEPTQWVNPVREWIENNPLRWDALLRTAMALELKQTSTPIPTSNERPSSRQHCAPAESRDGPQADNSYDPTGPDDC